MNKMTKNNSTKSNVSNSPVVMDLEQSIPAILTVLGRQLSGTAGARLNEKFGVNNVDWRILSALAKEQNLSAKQICTIAIFDKALVSRRLKLLNSTGLVKTKLDKNNKNLTRTALTEKGKRLYSKLVEEVSKIDNNALSELSKTEQKSLLDVLLKLRKSIP